ncbi:hypothetical protein [Nocardia noduli]|nr:hypothetical protein [Nocardia noduli]
MFVDHEPGARRWAVTVTVSDPDGPLRIGQRVGTGTEADRTLITSITAS